MKTMSSYNRFSSLRDIQFEKDRLRRKIKKQEKTLTYDWERIEENWRIVNKIVGTINNFFSSATIIGGVELGYKLISHLFQKKRKQKTNKNV